MSASKPFVIPKLQVYEAWKAVKANAGSAGVDKETIDDFELDLKNNLYRIWNRMSSGSYFPTPVKAVAIPKKNGGERILGIPTVADRVAQMVVKIVLEPAVEPIFLPDSYGYRPAKSALDAVAITRKRCWQYDWILEFDIKGLFDNIDHSLLLRALNKHTDCKWVKLYIGRWLTAPLQRADGTLVERTKGTPQGGVVTPRTQKVTFAGAGLGRRGRLESGTCRSGLRTGGGRGSSTATIRRGSLGAVWHSAGDGNRMPNDDGVVDHQHFFDH